MRDLIKKITVENFSYALGVWWTVGIFAALLLVASPSFTLANAEQRVIDKIVAVVGNTAISSRELATIVERVKENMVRSGSEEVDARVLLPEVLEQLIAVKLQLQEAERLGITVDEITLDSMLERIAESNGQTLAEMKAQIEQQQQNYSEVRESVRQEFIISQLRQRVIDEIEISEREMKVALRARNAKTLFRFSYLSAKLPESEVEVKKLVSQFYDLRKKMLYANDFSEWARKAAAEPSVDYKRSEFRRLKQLPELLQEKVLNMNIGDITSVIKTADKVYLFSLDDRRGEQLPQVVERQYHIRHILLRSDAMNSDSYIRKKLLAIKKRIENGESFERMAKRYSQDPGSGFKGGDLGWIPTRGLAVEFAQQVENAPRGEVIGPFSTNFGYHLLEVIAERRQDVGSDVQRREVVAQLRKEKSGEVINEWLLGLREAQHIDIRL